MLRFKPHYEMKPWGSRRFESCFSRELPEGSVGESWELFELEGRGSVVESGKREGEALGELWRSGLLGGSGEGPFPFLLKWLDTSEQMSVQVHPDAEFCQNTQCGPPKTEAWLVAEVEPKSKLLIGNYPGLDPQTLMQAVERGTLEKWMYETVPRPGDMYLVEAGTLHSVGAGFLLLEVQQPSDVTFRLYDWGRKDDKGEERELMVEQATACVHYDRFDLPRPRKKEVEGPSFRMQLLGMGARVEPNQLRVFAAHKGAVRLLAEGSEYELSYGDIVVAEVSDGPISVASGSCAFISESTSA